MYRLIDVEHRDIRVSTFLLFVQTAQSVLKYMDSYLYRKERLSVSKLIALQTLAKTSEGLTPSEIARWTCTERHNITTLVSRMKKEGLVTVERSSKNKRLVNIKLTDKGREVYNHAIPVTKEIFNQVMLSITEDDAVVLKEKLISLSQNIFHGLEGFGKHTMR